MAVPTIFLTRCHADADEEDGDADEEGDCNDKFKAQEIHQVFFSRFLLDVIAVLQFLFIACYWGDIHLSKRRVELGVRWHERPLFDPGLPIVMHCMVCCVVWLGMVW